MRRVAWINVFVAGYLACSIFDAIYRDAVGVLTVVNAGLLVVNLWAANRRLSGL